MKVSIYLMQDVPVELQVTIYLKRVKYGALNQ